MKDKKLKISEKDKTFVMSLIGLSDSSNKENIYNLLEKLNQSITPPDFIADLSILNLNKLETIWYKTIHETDSFAATVPCYYLTKGQKVIDKNELLDKAIEQMEEGVKILTIHPTPQKELYELSKSRMVPCTSRGGNIILQDLIHSNFSKPNVYVKILPELVAHAKRNNSIISIGSSYRSANIFDSLDVVQLREIKLQFEYAEFIKENGVEVIIETPGHANPRNIFKISELFKISKMPIMPLGPIITDTSIGMDHISAAIGATLLAISSNVKIIATVTEEEHTGNIPSDSAILYALKTAKLTAHIIDMYKFEDYKDDLIIASDRAKNKTCIYNRSVSIEGCSRCDNLCPLI